MNNSIILQGCVSEFKEKNELGLSESQIFELFCLTQLTKNYDFSFDEIEDSIVDGGMDGGIDSFLILLDDEYASYDVIDEYKYSRNTKLTMIISQVKKENSFKESVLDKLITSMPIIFNLEITEDELLNRFNPSLLSKIITMRSLWLNTIRKGGRVDIQYNYCCLSNEIEINRAFESKQDQIKKLTYTSVSGCTVSYYNYSSKELLELFQKSKPSRLELKFKEVPITTNFKDGYGYVGIVSLKDYFEFITDTDGNIIENIFESNIRHYQGDVDVNNKIKDSLENEFDIDFWWLNNGITIIAESPNQISKTLSIENVQIVNGLQTTFTLNKYYMESNSQDSTRSILIKVIIIESASNKKAIDKIISSTNSQNAVPQTLLRATDDIQRKIELYFYQKGYYYDRRKSFYKNLGKPSTKIFTIQFTAQAVQSIMNFEPDSARAKPTTLIKAKESYEKIFNENIDFEIYLQSCLIHKKVNDYIKNELRTENKSLAKAYSFHLSRCLVSFILEEAFYDKSLISKIKIDEINSAKINESFEYLKICINKFKVSSKTVIDNSVMKSGKFREYLNNELTIKFPTN